MWASALNRQLNTVRQYIHWAKRFIQFHDKRHPKDMGAGRSRSVPDAFGRKWPVSTSTQKQALSALLFLYREVLEQDLPWLQDVVRAKRPARLPVVLTQTEVAAVQELLGQGGRGVLSPPWPSYESKPTSFWCRTARMVTASRSMR